MMKRISCVLMIMIVLTLAGCDGEDLNDQIEASCRQFLDGLINGDMDLAYEVAQNVVAREEFEPIFDYYHARMSGIEEYELQQLGMNFEITGGVTTYMATFRMASDQGNYIIEIVDISNTDMPDNIIIGTEEELLPYLQPY